MKMESIKLLFTRSVGNSKLFLKSYSPEILIGVGIVGLIAGTVMTVKAADKAGEILDEAQLKNDALRKLENPKERKKELVMSYSKTGFELIKTYGPGLTLGAASIICILASQNILKKRTAVAVAAYKAVEQSFADYRKKVVSEYGADKDRELRYGIHKETIVEEVTDPETGKVKKQKKKVDVMDKDPEDVSIYARFFDELSSEYSKSPHYNLSFLMGQEKIANQLLIANGHLFLNEVYTMLGIPHSEAGAVVGWVYGGEGDNYVSFGLQDVHRKSIREFINGYENAVLLDFNVDGVMWDKFRSKPWTRPTSR